MRKWYMILLAFGHAALNLCKAANETIRSRSIIIAAVVAGLVTPCPAQALEKVVLGLPSPISISSAPFMMSVEMGYLNEEGLKLEIVVLSGDATLVPQIVNGSVDIGWVGPPTLIKARQPGKDFLPLKLFYNHLRNYTFEIVVPEDSSIKTIKQLRGKKIGIGGFTWSNVVITRSVLRQFGLEVGTNVQFVAVGLGGTAFRAFTDGLVDALNLFDTQHATMESRGIAIRRLLLPEKYADQPSNGFLAHMDTFEKNPDLLIRFGRAVAKGTVACDANPEACVKALWKHYPKTKPAVGSEEEKLAKQIPILRARLEKMTHFPEGAPPLYGKYPRSAWTDYLNILFEMGEIASKDISLETCYTNRFVSKMNAFDPEKVRQDAKVVTP